MHGGDHTSSERLVCSNNRHKELNAWSACNREINRRDENKSLDGLKKPFVSSEVHTFYQVLCININNTQNCSVCRSLLILQSPSFSLLRSTVALVKVCDQSQRQCVIYFTEMLRSDLNVK